MLCTQGTEITLGGYRKIDKNLQIMSSFSQMEHMLTDQAVYKSKNIGRNCISIFVPVLKFVFNKSKQFKLIINFDFFYRSDFEETLEMLFALKAPLML